MAVEDASKERALSMATLLGALETAEDHGGRGEVRATEGAVALPTKSYQAGWGKEWLKGAARIGGKGAAAGGGGGEWRVVIAVPGGTGSARKAGMARVSEGE